MRPARCVFPAKMVLALALVLAGAPHARPDDRINEAIDRGIDYLLAELEKNQTPTWKEDPANRVPGQVALEAYALVVAGVSAKHPLVKRHFEWLKEHMSQSNYTYGLSLYAFALDAAISQEESDLLLANMDVAQIQRKFRDNPNVGKDYRTDLAATLSRLAGIRQTGGGWNYGPGGNRFDNSNTQFAVLALGIALKRNISLDQSVWEKILDHFAKGQQREKGEEVKERLTLMKDAEVVERRLRGVKGEDRVEVEVTKQDPGGKAGGKATGGKEKDKGKDRGSTSVVKAKTVSKVGPEMPSVGTEGIPVFRRGWDYENKGGATWNMTCAGLSSLLLAREALKGKMPLDQIESVNAAVRDGYGWIMTNWGATGNGYYGLYSLEKVADIGEVKLFGGRDWYAEVSGHLLGQQQAGGNWTGGDHGGDDRMSTAFALLILNRATQLVTMNLMAQNPLSKIVVSGKKGAEGEADRSWVYVTELDSTVHYPTLLRMIRLRPHPKLLKFLKSIVQNYADEARGELVPELARARDEIALKDVRKIIDGYLADITGFSYSDPEDYMKWYARWDRVRLIGQQQKKEKIPDLLKYYETTKKSAPLRRTVMWALVQCKAREAIPLFVADLESADGKVRGAAYNSLKAFYLDFPPPFDPSAPESVRTKQIEAVKAWQTEQESKRG